MWQRLGLPQRLLIFNWWQLAQRRLPVDVPSGETASMSSLTKIVLSALEDLVSISFLNVWQHFTCDDLDFHHCMATFHEDLSRFWSPPNSFDLMLHTNNTSVHLTKWCQGHLNILINRYPSLCQQNRHHSMSSLTKFVLSALEDLVSISFLNVWQHFTCDDLDFHHCMATFHEDLSRFWSPPNSFDLMLHTNNTSVHLTKWCQGHLNILINRYPSLCQQNRHHSMSSLTKFVLSALEDLVSISFHKVWQPFRCDDLVVQPWMETFHNDTHEDLSRLEFAQIFWSHVARQQYHVFIFLTECSCSCDVKDA